MSKWIRRRLGRPLASLISCVLLVSLLMPLAPPPVQAQVEGSIDWNALMESTKAGPVPVVMLDFTNRSNYKTGLPGANMADALSLSLENTGKFSVLRGREVTAAMQDLGYSLPIDNTAQAAVADRLNSPYTVSGDINRIDIHRTKDGTYAEVEVSVYVVSRITRLPINGARVVQRSSPKVGYVGNADALVSEAISTAAYQAAQRIIERRMPMATVLLAESAGEVKLRGGSVVGLHPGMKMVAVRQGSVSGILLVNQVGPTDATCSVLENRKGVAPGDKVVPIFSVDGEGTAAAIEKKSRTSTLIAAAFGGLGLAALLASAGGEGSSPSVTAAPLADAEPLGYVYGANLVRWKSSGGNILKYIIYRVDNWGTLPIAVVPGSQTVFVDDARVAQLNEDLDPPALARKVYRQTVEFTISETGNSPVLLTDSDQHESAFFVSGALPTDFSTYEVSVGGTTGKIVTLNVPLYPGERARYCVQKIYAAYDDTVTDGSKKFILRQSELSGVSQSATMTEWPLMISPAQGDSIPWAGNFFCTEVLGATKYTLWLSDDPNFSDSRTQKIAAYPRSDGSGLVEALYPLSDILANPKLMNASVIFVRMGARASDSANPQALSIANYAGYVFSDTVQCSLTHSMLMKLQGSAGGGIIRTNKGAAGRADERRKLRR